MNATLLVWKSGNSSPLVNLKQFDDFWIFQNRKSESLPDGRVCVAIEIEGTRVFKGAGGNSKTAKSAAAKYALCVDLTKSKPT